MAIKIISENQASCAKILELTQLLFIKNEELRKTKASIAHAELELKDLNLKLNQQQSEIEEIISTRNELEGIQQEQTPSIWKWPPLVEIGPYDRRNNELTPYNPIRYNTNSCQVCGIDLTKAMGYCCNNANCPYPRITCSTSSIDTK